MIFLTIDEIIFIHKRVIERFGGIHGLRDMGLLEAAAARPQATFAGEFLYRDIYGMAAALGHSLLFNHPFIDGNKRTAFASMDLFLQRNMRIIVADDDACEAVIVSVLMHERDDHDLAMWLEAHTGSTAGDIEGL
jgi:death on curing protein